MIAQDRYDSLFRFYGQASGVDWLLLKAQAIAESNLDPRAKSPVGARGLTQFMPRTFAEWVDVVYGAKGLPGVVPENPEVAIRLQAAYMAKLRSAFGSVEKALAAYNWGWGRVRTHLREHGALTPDRLPTETRRYLMRIMALWEQLQHK